MNAYDIIIKPLEGIKSKTAIYLYARDFGLLKNLSKKI